MTSSYQNTARLERLIEKKSATLAIIRLKISGLKLVNADPRQIDRFQQFEQAYKTYIRYLENEQEQLRLVHTVRRK